MRLKTKYTIKLNRHVAELLAVLDEKGDVQSVIKRLIDHAQQGVYRPYAWERHWVKQVFFDDWLHRLEPGDPYERGGCVILRVRTSHEVAGQNQPPRGA